MIAAYTAGVLRALVWFNLRLAIRDIRRNPALALTATLALALACAAFTASLGASQHFYPPRPALPVALHQVELPHSTSLFRPYRSIGYEIPSWSGRTRVTWPEYQALASTGIPTRQIGTLRARLLVGAASDERGPREADSGRGVGHMESVRFTSADFFAFFDVPMGAGRPLARDDETGAPAAVAVLSAPLGRRLFGDARGSIGRTVLVDGRPLRVVGVVARDQSYWPDWDLTTYGTPQDAIYLPLGWFQTMRANPELTFFQSPVGPRFEDLLASDAVFVAFWAELSSPAQVSAFRAALDQRFGPAPEHYTLRDGPAWQRAFSNPQGSGLFVGLVALVLVAAGFKTARLLMAQGLSRRDELGIHRALGATRRSLFTRLLFEATLLSLPAAVAGVVGATPFFTVFNRLVADNDIPMQLTAGTLAGGMAATLLTGVLAAVYPGWRLSGTPVSLGADRL